MKAEIEYKDSTFIIDLSKPIDISIPISDKKGASAWYVDLPVIEPVRTEHFTGSVAEGGGVNFRNVFFNPHGNGTHTESVGHIAEKVYSVHDIFKKYFFTAELISIKPEKIDDDLVITENLLRNSFKEPDCEALIVRTIPNSDNKLTRNYSDSNPPYFSDDAMRFICSKNVKHLLVDMPSVDREKDDGKLSCHHIFWNYPETIDLEKTITELVFVPDEVMDGSYLLNMQLASLVNDASPSRPVLYPIIQKS